MKCSIVLAAIAISLHAACAALPPTTIPQKGCVRDGKTYAVGETFKPSPCEHCSCGPDGRAMCAIQDCAMPPCVDAAWTKDTCCPVCPNGPNCRDHDGMLMQPGQTTTTSTGAVCSCPTNPSAHFGFQTVVCKYPAVAPVTSAPVS